MELLGGFPKKFLKKTVGKKSRQNCQGYSCAGRILWKANSEIYRLILGRNLKDETKKKSGRFLKKKYQRNNYRNHLGGIHKESIGEVYQKETWKITGFSKRNLTEFSE